MSVGDSSRAAGRSWVMSGFASFANAVTRSVVSRLSRRKVGNTRKVSASCASRLAMASHVRFELRISSRSWPFRSVRAANTSPVSRIRPRVAVLCTRSTCRMSSVSSANGVRCASAALISAARPRAASPCWSNQVEKRWRVSGSKVRSTSSSSTVSATWPRGSCPPSGTTRSRPGPESPGDSYTYVSPSSVFCRRIARVSLGIGA
jgi:hypothetical protein